MSLRQSMKGMMTAGIFAVMSSDVPAEKPVAREETREAVQRESTQIFEKDFASYIQGKKIFIAGEDHGSQKDGQVFVRLLPVLKREGFTYIGIELDHDSEQSIVDAYYQTGDRNAEAQIRKTQSGEDLLPILDKAKELHMNVLCIDERKRKDGVKGNIEQEEWKTWWDHREEEMFFRVQDVMKNPSKKMAIYIGSAHGATEKEIEFQNGVDENGFPIMRSIRQPLGNRIITQYGEKDVGIIELNGCHDSMLVTCM